MSGEVTSPQTPSESSAPSAQIVSLGAWRLGARSLRRAADGATCLGYETDADIVSSSIDDYLTRIGRTHNQHLPQVLRWGHGTDGRAWFECEHLGRADSVIPLAELLYRKGGRLTDFECRHASHQLLDALESAHGCDVSSGRLATDMLLVDQRGRLLLEMFGFEELVSSTEAPLEARRRSDLTEFIDLAFHVCTGICLSGRETVRLSVIDEAPGEWGAVFRDLWETPETALSVERLRAAIPT